MRKLSFIEALLSDIGNIALPDILEENTERYEVLKIMIFTNLLGPIRRKIKASVDGDMFNIMVVEETFV